MFRIFAARFTNKVDLYYLFHFNFIWNYYQVILASWIWQKVVFPLSLCSGRSCIRWSVYKNNLWLENWQNLPVKPSWPGDLFVGSCLLPQCLKTFHYEILIDSQKVAKKKKCSRRSSLPFTQFSPMATSCIIIVQYQIQETDIDDIDTIQWPYLDF